VLTIEHTYWHSPCTPTPALPICPADYLASRGPDNVTADEIVRHVRPEGRAAVPDNVKAELLTRIKAFILQF